MEKKSLAFGNSRTGLVALLFCALFSLALASPAVSGQENKSEDTHVRKAAVAGSFYPADKVDLEQYLDALLRQADPPKIDGTIRAMVVPHAGYIYSGSVAAEAYKAIEGQNFKTVVIMCNSHQSFLNGIAIYKEGSFETPLGRVSIDEVFAAKLLAANAKIMDRPDIHAGDHVLEVQVPFLQRTLKDFKIVPVLFGNDDPKFSKILAGALENIIDDKTLLIASTDMSHYPPYEAANRADRETIDAILTGKAANLDKTLSALEKKNVPQADTFMCGVSGVRTVMEVAAAEGANKIKLLKYANSGDALGDKKRVVGYSAFLFVKPLPETTPAVDEAELNQEEQEELLKLARATVENYVDNKKAPSYTPTLPKLEKPAGAFVTLREQGDLRGCIGRFEPNLPLYIVVQQTAISAAAQDPRFPPVQPSELAKLHYEISVLSPLQKVANADEIVLGKHGVEIKQGSRRGVFLPQVATETGWSKEEFLSQLCSQKAGLDRDCWKDPKTDLYVFTAQVFPEEEN